MWHWLIVLIVLTPFILIIKNSSTKILTGKYICPNCGTQKPPKVAYKGSIFIEIILWLCFFVPGLIYSIWRQTTTYTCCQACGHTGVIPLDTPNGQLLAEKFNIKD